MLAYLDHLEAPGELDLETATEFIVLIAALLELKSRLMLSGEDEEELLDIEPAQAAEELLERMLDARRYRAAAGHLRRVARRPRKACASARRRCRRACATRSSSRRMARRARRCWGRRSAGCCACRRRSACATSACRGSPSAERLAHLRGLLRRGRFSFDEAVAGADRMTVAVTLFALLELYKRGEAVWEQEESFGEIAVHRAAEPMERCRRAVAG